MTIPLIILLVLQVLGLGMIIESHGSPKQGTVNAWHSFIGLLVLWTLLFLGGALSA